MTDINAYLDSLAQEGGFNDEEKAVLLKMGENEKFSKALDGSVMRQSDYSRKHDSLAKDREAFDEEKQKMSTWYATASKEHGDALAERDAAATKSKAYEDAYGPLDDSTTKVAEKPIKLDEYVSKKDLAEHDNVRDKAWLGLLKDVTIASDDYRDRFGEALPAEELEKKAVESGRSFSDTYKDFIEPKLEAQRKAETDEKVKKAHEEGRQEVLTEHHFPADAKTREPSALFEPPKENAIPTDSERKANFMKEWNSGQAAD